jgi:DNA polymerase III subunit epsilon
MLWRRLGAFYRAFRRYDITLPGSCCATEADALVDLAHDPSLPKSEVIDIHHRYLRALAQAVWSDGVLTVDERRDVDTVATARP